MNSGYEAICRGIFWNQDNVIDTEYETLYKIPLWIVRADLDIIMECEYITDCEIQDISDSDGNLVLSFRLTQKFIDRYMFEQL